MKKVKVSELSGNALDWAVAKCEGDDLEYGLTDDERYSTNWAQGGPIIEREEIDTTFARPYWYAYMSERSEIMPYDTDQQICETFGDTLLQAAMRCYVASKMGEEVEVPDEL